MAICSKVLTGTIFKPCFLKMAKMQIALCRSKPSIYFTLVWNHTTHDTANTMIRSPKLEILKINLMFVIPREKDS